MTAHHQSNAYRRARARAYPILKASLPAPCCDCGRMVEPGDKWEVGHVIAATYGGDDSLANLAPSHVRCNRSKGGAMGARTTNRARDHRAMEERRTLDD